MGGREALEQSKDQNSLQNEGGVAPQPALDQETVSRRDQLRSKLDSVSQQNRWGGCDFETLLCFVHVEIMDHTRSFGSDAVVLEEINDEVARFLAGTGLPSRTDYSIVDPSGERNREEAFRHARWTRQLHAILPDPEVRAEVGVRAIEYAAEEFLQQQKYNFPPTYAESSGFLHSAIRFKIEMGANITQDDAEAAGLLRATLPALVYRSDSWAVLHHFPLAFAEPDAVLAEAKTECLTRALNDVRDRQYGNCYDRLMEATRVKEFQKIPTRLIDQLTVLHYLESHWSLEGEPLEKLVSGFDLTKPALCDAIREGIAETLNNWSYDKTDSSWYRHSLQRVQATLASYEIPVTDLAVDPMERLPAVLATEDPVLVSEYLKTFQLPETALLENSCISLTTDLIRKFISENYGSENRQVAESFGVIKTWAQKGLFQLTYQVAIELGNEVLANEPDYRFERYLKFVQLDGSRFPTEEFRPGATRLFETSLLQGDLSEAKRLANKYGIDPKSQDFREAALTGIGSIFSRARGGNWDYSRFEELTNFSGIVGRIDHAPIRELVLPVLISELHEGSRRALSMASWLHDKFVFAGPMEGEVIRVAALAGFKGALAEGNGVGMRFVANKVSSELSIPVMAEATREEWSRPEGKQHVLENLRYLSDGVLHKLNPELGLSDYQSDIGVAGSITYDRYMEFRATGRKVELKGFISKVRKEMDALISCDAQDTQALRAGSRYRELVLTVYPNNWGPEATYESSESCADRTEDLKGLKIRRSQSFTLAEGVVMRLKAGAAPDSSVTDQVENLIEGTVHRLGAGNNQRRLQRNVLQFCGAQGNHNLAPVEYQARILNRVLTIAEEPSEKQSIKEVLVAHRLAEFADLRNYMRGTRANIEESINSDYVQLLEIQNFLGDQMRESITSLVQQGLQDQTTFDRAKGICTEAARMQIATRNQEIVSRARPERLGMSESFKKQVARELSKELKRQPVESEVLSVIAASEADCIAGEGAALAQQGLSDGFSKRILPIVRTQRERTFQLARELGHEVPARARLTDFGPAQLQPALAESAIPVDRETVEAYFTQLLHDEFEAIMREIDTELQKFEADVDAQSKGERRTVNCYITKNHSSAHARKTAGVCVSIDNPDRDGGAPLNQWDMKEFFQMVLQDDARKVCLGAVLLHLYEDRTPQGMQRVLVASFNPSSTFLYQVNGKELFQQLQLQLERFARDNKIDKVTVSTGRYNRTNRNGGEFEEALNEAISSVNQKHRLQEPQPICHAYRYTNDELHVLWNRTSRWNQMVESVRSFFRFSR